MKMSICVCVHSVCGNNKVNSAHTETEKDR